MNWDNFIIKCRDKAKFEKLIKNTKSYSYCDDMWEMKDGVLHAKIPHVFNPFDELRDISKKNPELVIDVQFSLESEWYKTSYNVRCKGGVCKEGKPEPNYNYLIDEKIKIAKGEGLFNEVIRIFKRIDVVKKGKNQRKYIDFVDGPIKVTVENDNYRLIVEKTHAEITSVQLFEKQRREVIDYHEWDSLPF